MPAARFSGLLARWLATQGLSLSQGAARLGLSRSQAHAYREGTACPAATRAPALAPILGLDPDYLRSVLAADKNRRVP